MIRSLPLAALDQYGRYSLVRKVGQGGMAEIWEARTEGVAGFQKTVALKRILPELAENPDFLEMFLDEARLVAALVHPNIVQVFELGKVGPQDYFIAMEYVPGASLDRLLARLRASGQRLPSEVAAYLAIEVCKGLGYVHSRTDAAGKPLGLVHRDISPHNLLVSNGGDVKVSDFGIARMATAVGHTAAGQVRGKVGYMSPQQAAGRPLDGRSDLFSVGVVLMGMLTGRRLFQAEDPPALYARVLHFGGLTAAELATLPPELRSVVKTALHPNPAKRFQTALQMERALAAAFPSGQVIAGRQMLASMMEVHFEASNELTPATPVTPATAVTEDTPIMPFTEDTPAPVVPTAAWTDLSGQQLPLSGPQATESVQRRPLKPDFGVVTELPLARPPLRARRMAAAFALVLLLAAGTILSRAHRGGSGLAQLNVKASQPSEVWLDGNMITTETPLLAYPIRAGRHHLRTTNAVTGAGAEQIMEVVEGAVLTAQVDLEAGTSVLKP